MSYILVTVTEFLTETNPRRVDLFQLMRGFSHHVRKGMTAGAIVRQSMGIGAG